MKKSEIRENLKDLHPCLYLRYIKSLFYEKNKKLSKIIFMTFLLEHITIFAEYYRVKKN